MQISLNVEDIEQAHLALERSNTQVRSLDFAMTEGASKSAAMDAFRADVEKLACFSFLHHACFG